MKLTEVLDVEKPNEMSLTAMWSDGWVNPDEDEVLKKIPGVMIGGGDWVVTAVTVATQMKCRWYAWVGSSM